MSEFNRRDLLKYFGIGATVVPVLGGVPKLEAPAKLIEEAKIEPVELAQMSALAPLFRMNDRDSEVFIAVEMVSKRGRYRFSANSFIVEANPTIIDITTDGALGFREFRGGYPIDVSWTLRGITTTGRYSEQRSGREGPFFGRFS